MSLSVCLVLYQSFQNNEKELSNENQANGIHFI